MSLRLVQSGHFATEFRCPLLGVKRTCSPSWRDSSLSKYLLSGGKPTSIGRCRMSALDPKRAHIAPRYPNYIVHCCCPDEERSFDDFHSHKLDPSSRHNQGGVFDLWRQGP